MWSRREQIAVYDFPRTGSGMVAPAAGPVLWCDTENGATLDTAKDRNHAVNTMDAVFDIMDALPASQGSDGIVYVRGHVAEQLTAPLGCYGWRIIGLPGGRPRHATESGVDINGNGAHWSEASTALNAPLLTLRQQGWEIENILFVPESGYGAIRARREETATYPDASHMVVRRCKFISGGTRVGYGIDDYGSGYHFLIEDNEFNGLEYAYKAGNVGIAAPGKHVFRGNDFSGNKHDLAGNFYGAKILWNTFRTAYDGTTHPNTVNCALTADAGVAADANVVAHNIFADAAANVTIAKGYKPATGDIWRNWVTDAADAVVAVPS